MRRIAYFGCVTVSVLCITGLGLAQEAAPENKEQSQRQLELMKDVIAELKAEPEAKFAADPLLRYSDPVRGLLDASLWRLGETGRPKAIVTLELYRKPNNIGHLSYEFTLLSDEKVSLHSARKISWEPPVTKPQFKPIADAPAPADSKALRLVQMKSLVRRFKVSEVSNGTRIECRLMPRPIDRYEHEGEKILDGAVFAFAHGTNPEIAVMLENDGDKWSYQIVRLTSAAAKVDLDGQTVYEVEQIRSYQPNQPYSSESHPIELP